MENYLPIGTVVRLNKGIKYLMICGRFQKGDAGEITYDYSGCLYPEGNLSSKYMFLFNNSDIEEIVYMGYINEQEKELRRKLSQLKNKEEK